MQVHLAEDPLGFVVRGLARYERTRGSRKVLVDQHSGRPLVSEMMSDPRPATSTLGEHPVVVLVAVLFMIPGRLRGLEKVGFSYSRRSRWAFSAQSTEAANFIQTIQRVRDLASETRTTKTSCSSCTLTWCDA